MVKRMAASRDDDEIPQSALCCNKKRDELENLPTTYLLKGCGSMCLMSVGSSQEDAARKVGRGMAG